MSPSESFKSQARPQQDPKPTDAIMERIFEKAPTLARLGDASSLASYMAPAFEWQASPDTFPYRKDLQTRIVNETARLHGAETAAKIDAQLSRHFTVETGPHLSLPRDQDRVALPASAEDNVNTLIFQGTVVSAAAHKKAGDDIHLSFVTGRVTGSNPNSARYFQPAAGQALTVIGSKYISNSPQNFIPAINEERLAELDKELKKMGPSLTEADQNRAQRFMANMRKHPDSLRDQVAVAHSDLMTEVLSSAGMSQCTLEYEEVARDMFIDMLDDPRSLLHRIFSDPVLRESFINDFSNIGTGWKQGETPFDVIGTKKGITRVEGNYDGDLSPATLKEKIRSREIMPKGALIYFTFIAEAGLLPLGGMFQTTYCTALRDRSVPLLQKMGDHQRAEAVAQMPTHIATVSPAWGLTSADGQTHMTTYGDALSGKCQLTQKTLDDVMNLSGKTALLTSALCLHNFLVEEEDLKIGDDQKTLLLAEIAHQGDAIQFTSAEPAARRQPQAGYKNTPQ
ncbi:MAG: hypothetical protein ACK4NR_05295 [Micavibrio sp.]